MKSAGKHKTGGQTGARWSARENSFVSCLNVFKQNLNDQTILVNAPVMSHDVVTFDLDPSANHRHTVLFLCFLIEICYLDVGRTAALSNSTPSRLRQVIFSFIKGKILFHILRISGEHSHTFLRLTVLLFVVCLFVSLLHVTQLLTRDILSMPCLCSLLL